MNRGSAVRTQLSLALHTMVASTLPAGAGVTKTMATRPTPSRDKAIQIPLASMTSIRASKRSEIKIVSMPLSRRRPYSPPFLPTPGGPSAISVSDWPSEDSR